MPKIVKRFPPATIPLTSMIVLPILVLNGAIAVPSKVIIPPIIVIPWIIIKDSLNPDARFGTISANKNPKAIEASPPKIERINPEIISEMSIECIFDLLISLLFLIGLIGIGFTFFRIWTEVSCLSIVTGFSCFLIGVILFFLY